MKKGFYFILIMLLGNLAFNKIATAKGLPIGPPLPSSPHNMSSTLAKWIEDYSRQNHRTGSKEDADTANWLKEAFAENNIECALDPFTFKRPVTEEAMLVLNTLPHPLNMEGMALLNSQSTAASGYTGVVGSEKENNVVPVIYRYVMMPDRTVTQQFMQKNREDVEKVLSDTRYPAVIIITQGNKEGFAPFNIDLSHSYPRPVILLSSIYADDIELQSKINLSMRLTTAIRRREATAFNVVAKILGTDPNLKPLILVVNRSAWYRAAAEHGSALAAMLYVAERLKKVPPVRTVYFLALTGHEFGDLGLKQFETSYPGLVQNAYAWVAIGDNIAAEQNPSYTFYVNTKDFKNAAVTAFTRNHIYPLHVYQQFPASSRLGQILSQNKVPFLQISGMSNRCFHMDCDKWPNAVNLGSEEKFARSLLQLVNQLVAQPVTK